MFEGLLIGRITSRLIDSTLSASGCGPPPRGVRALSAPRDRLCRRVQAVREPVRTALSRTDGIKRSGDRQLLPSSAGLRVVNPEGGGMRKAGVQREEVVRGAPTRPSAHKT